MARSMFSLGMLTDLAVSMARRSRGFPAGSPPPSLAATVISRIFLVQVAARRLSVSAFLCLICFHLLCPAIGLPPDRMSVARQKNRRVGMQTGNISSRARCFNARTHSGAHNPAVPPPTATNRSLLDCRADGFFPALGDCAEGDYLPRAT